MNTVILEKKEKVGIIKFNRPESLNCINEELADEFNTAITRLENDEAINIIVVTGMGKAFCAGGDIKAIKNLNTKEEAYDFVAKAGTISERIYHSPKPVIAMVNGAAAGAGFNVALACDLIFASHKAKFIQSFVNVGLAPDCGGHYLLPNAIGKHLAKQYMFEANPVTAEKALELGFVNYIFSPEELEKATLEYAEKLANKAPLALQQCKKLLNNSDGMTLKEVLVAETEIQSILAMTEDSKEGLTAFTEKRQPIFKGK